MEGLLRLGVIFVAVLPLVFTTPIEIGPDSFPKSESRVRRQTEDVRNCDPNPPYYPETIVRTDTQLEALRALMVDNDLDAYIIPSEDAHQSEDIAEADRRRTYISGFDGSAGLAIVTADLAAVWVDGRYFLQAKMQLDCNWMSMESGEEGVPISREWLVSQDSDSAKGADLPDNAKVGFDPTLISVSSFNSYKAAFDESGRGITMHSLTDNLVDEVWGDTKPSYLEEPLLILLNNYTGRSWQEKIYDTASPYDTKTVRELMAAKEADALVVHKLDEICWLFNLRGKDIPYNPMFISYAIIQTDTIRLREINTMRDISQRYECLWPIPDEDSADESWITGNFGKSGNTDLYMYDMDNRLTNEIRNHLRPPSGSCSGDNCIDIIDYEDFLDDLETLGGSGKKIWHSDTASYAIYERVDEEENRIMEASPVLLMKARKNPVELEGLREACWKDSVSLCNLFGWLEEKINDLPSEDGDLEYLSELSVEAEAIKVREVWGHEYTGLSFRSISAFKDHGAIIHYSSSETTDVPITRKGTYMLDSGAQFKEGTTDITRTMHFGTPTAKEKDSYTRVLMGHIDLVNTHFRTGVYGRDIDAIAREPLWSNGLDYRHGTGHGIGHFLNVHEGPGRINIGYRDGQEPMEEGMFFSDEPGYYEDGAFGIRLENDMIVVPAETQYSFSTYKYMTFEMLSLVPFDPNLINFGLLSPKQLDWYNAYNQRIRDEVGPHLNERGRKWMESMTEEVGYTFVVDSATFNTVPLIFITISALLTQLL